MPDGIAGEILIVMPAAVACLMFLCAAAGFRLKRRP